MTDWDLHRDFSVANGKMMSSEVFNGERIDRSPAVVFLSQPHTSSVIVALGFLPLLYWHVAGLLERPHYQFLLLLPVAIWMLIASMPRDAEIAGKNVSDRYLFLSSAILILSAGGLAIATWAWSPWIASVSAMFAFLSLLLFIGGIDGLKKWLPIWAFCWILIPLPFGMDEDLIVRLRTVTTRMTSAVLDQMGILHQSYANVIELPDKPLFIADACSGIQSLYVLMAMALFLAVFQRRLLLHTLLLLCSTFGLVLVENVTRIVTVAVALGWRRDLSAGTNHTLLGIVLFCVSAVLIVTTDQLLLFLLPETPFRSLSKMAGWLTKRSKADSKTGSVRPTSTANLTLWCIVAGCFPILGIAQLTRMPADMPTFATLFPDDFSLPKLGEEAMPKDLQGFTRDTYETIDRVVGDPFGKSSQRWTYRKGNLTVGISLDYPYDGVKDLCECYSLVGWDISEKQLLDKKTLSASLEMEDSEGPVARGALFRDLFGQGQLLFSSFDLSGNCRAVIKEIDRGDVDKRAENRLLSFGNQQEDLKDSQPPKPPYIQVHLLARSFDEITPEVQSDLLLLFIEARRILTPIVLKANISPLPENQTKGGN